MSAHDLHNLIGEVNRVVRVDGSGSAGCGWGSGMWCGSWLVL